MKKLLFILLLIPFFASSQVWQQNNIEYGYQYKGIKTIRALGLPKIQTTSGQGRDTGFVYYDTLSKSIRVYDGVSWINQKGVDSVWITGDTLRYRSLGTTYTAGVIAGGTTPPPASGYGLVQPGSVIWSGTGLKFYITAAKYYVNSIYKESIIDSVTLTAADPTNPRFDIIGLDSTGHAFKITGTAAASPVKPQANPSFQLELTTVLVAAGATTPTEISNLLIYDENVGPTAEWDASTHSASVDPNSTTSSFSGSKSIKFNIAMFADVATVVNSTGIKASDYTNLYFKFKFGTWGGSLGSYESGIVLRINYGFAFPNGVPILLKHGNYGLDTTNTTAWQNIVIPLADFHLSVDSITSIMFVAYNGPGGSTYWIDAINLQGGITPAPGSGTSVAWNDITGKPLTFTPSAHTHTLSDLLQSGATTGQVPKWNGSAWVPANDSVGTGGGGGATLINGFTNLGSGAQVGKDTSSNKINLRSILGGSGMTVTQNTNDITITPNVPYTVINGGANKSGSGVAIFKDTSSNKLNFKRLKAGTGITVTDNTDSVTITNTSTNVDSSAARVRTGTYADRIAIASPQNGEVFTQTDRLAGLYLYEQGSWRFHGDPLSFWFYNQFSRATSGTATDDGYNGLISLSGASASDFNILQRAYSDNWISAILKTTDVTISTTLYDSIEVDSVILYIETELNASALSDGTDSYGISWGFDNATGNYLSGDRIIFRYNHDVNSGNWETRTVAAGSGSWTTKNTGVPFVANSNIKLAMEIDGYARTVKFYINDALVTTHSGSEVPFPNATTLATGISACSFNFDRLAGTTNRTFLVNYFFGYYVKKNF